MTIGKVDVLAIGAHPDDIEMGAGGTIINMVNEGKKVGLLDLTQGELGTRGTPKLRKEEALHAMKILGASWRYGFDLGDGFFEVNEDNKLLVAKAIRVCQPEIILTNAKYDRHPDHGRSALLVKEAAFISGLEKVKLYDQLQKDLEPWRPRAIYYSEQDYTIQPDLLVDISESCDQKYEAIRAFKSQFYDPHSTESESPLTSPHLLDQLKGRNAGWGRMIQKQYAEAYNVDRLIGVKDLFDLI